VPPETRYARADGGVHIAYQVHGDGPPLVLALGWITNVEMAWDAPAEARFLRRLGTFATIVRFDKRGVGLSDRGVGTPSIEERMDDIRAVLDAAGIDRAHLFGESEGGPLASQFAATYPERVRSLVLYGTGARITRADDYPWGMPPEALDSFCDWVEEVWGTPTVREAFDAWQPDTIDTVDIAEIARMSRRSASPREAADALRRNRELDVRGVLSTLRVPTLVLHREGDRIFPIGHAEFLAGAIPGARLQKLPGADHVMFAEDGGVLVDAVEEWITGSPPAPAVNLDRVLATVLFTDLVDSTAHAAAAGDRAWRDLLDDHDALVARQVERYRGTLVKSTGDGALATFDGPARAVHCAEAVLAGVRAVGLEARAGLHAGEVERRGDDIGGIAVHLAARVAGAAAAGETLVTSTVKDLTAGSDITYDDRGEHRFKGFDDPWRVYRASVR
jgi:pimeloyl-ACP methyl ester carboxylesterase